MEEAMMDVAGSEPAAKKLRGAGDGEVLPEQETDAKPQTGQGHGVTGAFCEHDTTLNLLKATEGGMLMTLNDGGVQYLLAGGRSNLGVKAGRYVFEVKLTEWLHPPEASEPGRKVTENKHLFRLGVSMSGSAIIMDGKKSVFFDNEGNCINASGTTQVGASFSAGSVATLLLNLEDGHPNANTISLFLDGKRWAAPQPVPDSMRGKPLFPTLNFRSMTVQTNFGPALEAALPFKCHSISEAADAHVEITREIPAKSETREALFPVCLPNEGSFEWLDSFMAKHPQFVEISDRTLLDWAVNSDLHRSIQRQSLRHSRDRPDMGFAVPTIDEGGVKQQLVSIAAEHNRNVVLMEVKRNFMKEERAELMKQFKLPSYKKVALVMVGEPDKEFKATVQARMLKCKQEKSDRDFEAKKADTRRKKVIELRLKQVEKARRKAERAQKKKEREEKAAQEAAAKAEEQRKIAEEAAQGANGDTEKKEQKKEEVEEKKAEPEDEESEEMEGEPEVPEDTTPPPKVDLSEGEKLDWFNRDAQLPDLAAFVLNTSFSKFTLPNEDEGFDEVKYGWASKADCIGYVQDWQRAHKLTTRIEDLAPSDWFRDKWQRWQKDLQKWHMKHVEVKNADPTKRAAKKAEEDAKVASAKKEGEAEGEGETKKEEEKDPMKLLEAEMDAEELDIFGIDDVCDVRSEPLFVNFTFEDWALLSLRFELHLLVHAFCHDAKDPERVGIHPEHLAFYYNTYYKKALNPKNYSVESIEDLINLIKDAVIISVRTKVVESQLTDDLESNEIFVKLTEESRRDRHRRLDAGDDSALLKFARPQPVNQQAESEAPRPPAWKAQAMAPVQAAAFKGAKGWGGGNFVPQANMWGKGDWGAQKGAYMAQGNAYGKGGAWGKPAWTGKGY